MQIKYILLSSILFFVSEFTMAQAGLMENEQTTMPKKVVEIQTKTSQASITLKKGQKLRLNSFKEYSKAQLTFLDISGKVVFQEDIYSSAPLSSGIDLASGIYFLQVAIGEQNFRKKLMVMN